MWTLEPRDCWYEPSWHAGRGHGVCLNDHPVRRELVRETDGIVIFREFADGDSYPVAITNAPENVPPNVAVVVAEDQLFVMGDNRYNAYDSRFSGSIPFSSIVGKVIWP
jgi:hypothetical protein